MCVKSWAGTSILESIHWRSSWPENIASMLLKLSQFRLWNKYLVTGLFSRK